jgi:hypothetical protein
MIFFVFIKKNIFKQKSEKREKKGKFKGQKKGISLKKGKSGNPVFHI